MLIEIPGKSWSSIRILLLMVLGGCLLASLSITSNFNTFLVCATMSLFGIFVGHYDQPSATRWLRIVVWILEIVAFLLAAIGVVTLFEMSGENFAGRVGKISVSGLIALLLGVSWLRKGWKLVLSGITPIPAAEPTVIESAPSKTQRTALLYVSMFIGLIILTLVLGSRAFLDFSDSVFPSRAPSSHSQNDSFYPLLALMLLAWWPYKCWEAILRRQPNTVAKRVKFHTTATIIAGAFFIACLSIAITFGIQNGHDRMTTAQVEQDRKDFQAVAAKIGDIKTRDFRTVQDFVEGYSEMEPLLDDFDTKLHRINQVLAEASRNDKSRGLLNYRYLFGTNHEREWMSWDVKTFEALRQDSELTRRQIEVAKQIANVPKQQQVAFWNQNLQPLLDEEYVLRGKIAVLLKTKPEDEAFTNQPAQ